jgi:uridine kinase
MTESLDIDDLADRVMASGGHPTLVGIDGPSGSGKTTLAARLVERLDNVTAVGIDDFVSWPDFAGWWPRFDRECLTPLLDGCDAHYQGRDWEHDEYGTSLGPWMTAAAAAVIVIEGVTCTRKAVTDRLSYAIWVEAPYNVRLQRGINRDGEDHRQLWVEWMEKEAAFFADDGTKARADVRISTGNDLGHDGTLGVVL